MNKTPSYPLRAVRSFVLRNSRATAGQRAALANLYPKYTLPLAKPLVLAQHFAPGKNIFLEIGFGSGRSLFAAAQTFLDDRFIGIETHEPGIGGLLNAIEAEQLSNLHIIKADAAALIPDYFSENSLAGVHIFFPDPWPKRRHHDRRLVQIAFIQILVSKLKIGGQVHLATDWEDYAIHMMKVLDSCEKLKNVHETGFALTRSPYRPILSKYEQFALDAGRHIWDLQFARIS